MTEFKSSGTMSNCFKVEKSINPLTMESALLTASLMFFSTRVPRRS